MANFDMDLAAQSMRIVRKDAKRSAHVQRAQQMLVAAGLCAMLMVAVAGTLLSQAI